MKLEFLNVSKVYNRKKQLYDLSEVSISFTELTGIALLSAHERSSSTLLKLISGIDHPTRGTIKRQGVFTSTIGDTSYFHRELSGEESIRFISKIYGQDPNRIIDGVKNLAEINKELKQKAKSYNPLLKRKIAISASLLMQSDFYQLSGALLHQDQRFNAKIQRKLLEISNQSTIIVVAGNPDILKKYTTSSIVIDYNGHLQTFNDVQSGINAHQALKEGSHNHVI